jgi:hypothetical protein
MLTNILKSKAAIVDQIDSLQYAAHCGHTSYINLYAVLQEIADAAELAKKQMEGRAIYEIEQGHKPVGVNGYAMQLNKDVEQWSYEGVEVHTRFSAELEEIERLARVAHAAGKEVIDDYDGPVEPATRIVLEPFLTCEKLGHHSEISVGRGL